MNKGTAGALALILLWVSFAAFFVSFHPGGIKDDMFKNKDNPDGNATNPRDVLIWIIKRAISGTPKDEQASDSQPTQVMLWRIRQSRREYAQLCASAGSA